MQLAVGGALRSLSELEITALDIATGGGIEVLVDACARHATSAPARPMLWRKMGVTTVIAAVLTAVIHWIISSEFISLVIV